MKCWVKWSNASRNASSVLRTAENCSKDGSIVEFYLINVLLFVMRNAIGAWSPSRGLEEQPYVVRLF